MAGAATADRAAARVLRRELRPQPERSSAGGVALAFSLAGAPIFANFAARHIDQRLVLSGYRPAELLLARLVVLESYGAVVAVAFGGVMAAKSDPPRPGLLIAGVVLVGVVAVPFGLMLGALLPSELEAALVMIGAVGIQLTLDQPAHVGKLLPFWRSRQLLEGSLGDSISTPHAIETTVAYAAALLVITFVLARPPPSRCAPRAHGHPTPSAPTPTNQ